MIKKKFKLYFCKVINILLDQSYYISYIYYDYHKQISN